MSRARLTLVTTNEHKLAELRPLFAEYDVVFENKGIEKMEIRDDSVEKIAREAAKHAFEVLRRPVVVDDTGLYIDALSGFPRSYPAFVLETIGRQGVLRLLKGETDRKARFVTGVGYADGERVSSFTGEMVGEISLQERGSAGFGYDPIFIPDGFERTYAELTFDEKTAISHRTKAFRAFLRWYRDELNKS
ncbi:XTP/dITP diphosphatase [Candidatus Thorarchaeota archaeon]|nr:MAG: XTP/dITP diphosphatase [Candidatus Thorarchaeota archaeon]